MKIVQIDTYDITGGAARAAYRLHKGLRQIGQDCRTLVRYKAMDDDWVLCVTQENEAEQIDEGFFIEAIQTYYIDSHRTGISNTIFSLPCPGYDISVLPIVQGADVINLHWIADYQSSSTLSKLFALGKPVVWTLHDQWAFTGGCHYAAGCKKYERDCIACPQLSDDPFNLPAAVLKDKIELFKGADLSIVTPSRWMASCARESKLFRDLRIEVIPNSLETDVFKPMLKEKAKKDLGLEAGTVTLLFGAEYGSEKRKGFRELMAAVRYCMADPGFQNMAKEDRIRILCFGHPGDKLDLAGVPVVSLGYLTSDEEVAAAYCAADLFIQPSLEDNLPNTMLEAMSCGTPVVAFDVGGMPDMVINGVTGQLAALGDAREMGEAILTLIFDPDKLEAMGEECRRKMCDGYSLEVQARRYLDLYEELGASPDRSNLEPLHVQRSEKTQTLSSPLELSVGPNFGRIYDQVLLSALKKFARQLQERLEVSETDREERGERISDLVRHFKASEADNQARLRLIDDLNVSLKEKDVFIEDLDGSLKERSDLIDKLDSSLKDQETSLKEKDSLIKDLDSSLKERAELINNLDISLREKDGVINELRSSIEEKEVAVKDRDGLVTELEQSLYSYRRWNPFYRVKRAFIPKLGELEIHPPRPLHIPRKYERVKRLKNYPKISICTPSYNQARFLEQTIKSVLDQGYRDLEYVVQDGGSTDGSVEILRKHEGRLARWECKEDNGQANAINLGLRHTNGEIMAYLNSDDLLLPGALYYVAGYFEKHPDVDVIYGHRILINEHNHETGRWVLPPHEDDILSWADYIPQETLFWRRRIWEKAGGHIDESFRFAMDWDLILRFRDVGAKFIRLPRFLGAFRVHSQQKTSAALTELGHKEMGILRERCHKRPVSDIEILDNIRHYMRRHVLCETLYRIGLLRY